MQNQALTSRFSPWIILGSLLVNCFLLGLLVAPMLSHDHGFPPPPPPPEHFIERLIEIMPPDDATVLRNIYLKEEPGLSAGRQKMDAAMSMMSTILQQPTVNQDDLNKALADIDASQDQIHAGMANIMRQASTQLSPQGRRILADNSMHPHRGMRGGPDAMPLPQAHPPY